MATAANLTQAAGQSSENLFPFWVANTLRTKLATFSSTCLALFPEMEINQHPAANWCILMSSLAFQMPLSSVTFTDLQTAIDYVYRMCLMCSQLVTQALITAGQGNAVLASYNLLF